MADNRLLMKSEKLIEQKIYHLRLVKAIVLAHMIKRTRLMDHILQMKRGNFLCNDQVY